MQFPLSLSLFLLCVWIDDWLPPLVTAVPNVSFTVYAPGFLSRFFESHAVMFQGNAGLKPKEGEVTSRPWQWPINYRVSSSPLPSRRKAKEMRRFFCLHHIFSSLPILAGAIFLWKRLSDLSAGQSDNMVEQFSFPGDFFDSISRRSGEAGARLSAN